MDDLASLQARFQNALLADDDAILSDIPASPREDKDVLLGVYKTAYGARLMDVLVTDYPNLHAWLGDEQMAEMAIAYIADHPSEYRSARWFGRKLPDFLRRHEIYSEHEELADLADLELALIDVFDEADFEPLSMAGLASLSPEQWPELTLAPAPSVRRLDMTTNAAEIWLALAEETEPPRPRLLDEAEAVLVFRQDVTAMFRPLPREEAMMWDSAVTGTRFGILCGLVASHGGEDDAAVRAAGYLQNWVASGILAA